VCRISFSVGSDPTDLLCSVRAIKTNSFIPAFTISFQMDLSVFFLLPSLPSAGEKNVCPSFSFSRVHLPVYPRTLNGQVKWLQIN
jgi:hypothetical protein